jgi:phospholipase C
MLTSCALVTTQLAPTALATVATKHHTLARNDSVTTTPIQHVIIIVGENRTYDHLFATYVPPKGSTNNLLSEKIVKADGSQGSNFNAAAQHTATDTSTYSISPTIDSAYQTLPIPSTGYAPSQASDSNPPPFATKAAAGAFDYGIENRDLKVLTTGATGLPQYSHDTRIPNVKNLPNGPFPLTGLYDAYANSPIHRFFQSWQQMDCSVAAATAANPSGCQQDLFPWVEVTAGFNGDNATNMGFYNVQQGDMPYFKSLADTYAVGDNYHQPIAGGTGANSIVLGYAGPIWYTNSKGQPAKPPHHQIENPNPKPGSNNNYIGDGYAAGSYVNCSDTSQSGVKSITDYLAALPYHPAPNCGPNKYYLVNNYNPGYNEDGTVNTGTFTIPPSSAPSIGDVLNAHQVSWAYYGEDWDRAVAHQVNAYCNICNPFQYETQIMADKKQRNMHMKDTHDLYAALQSGNLPAVSYVKPSGLNDGHPASSKFSIFEAFTKKIIDKLKANPALYATTAVFITVDEGGGYYDSGYVQPVDFFGDASRIPLIVVSPFSQGVGVVHGYGDHASILKFIEANWSLPPVSPNSRDNLPDPQQNGYVVTNAPALDDLMDFFNFGK